MRLPVAYRSLARPSSVLEPSHSPDGIATPKDKLYKLSCPIYVRCDHPTVQVRSSDRIGIPFCTINALYCYNCISARHYIPIQRPKTNMYTASTPNSGKSGVSSSPPTLLGRCTNHHKLWMNMNLCEYSRSPGTRTL